jgi:glutamyl-tRNA synthetase
MKNEVSFMSTLRVRFAPSPTGYVHVGSLRTALYNWLFARRSKGVFILRIEDTDQKRYVEGAVEDLIETLAWAGLDYDEGPGKEGAHGPYVQSERTDIYRRYAGTLVEKGFAYRCFCTPERLDEMRREQEAGKSPNIMYDRWCLGLSAKEIERLAAEAVPHTVRLKAPRDRSVVIDDIIRGIVSFEGVTIDDQVLLKSDGFPTYHLANVVDDHLMGVTHVIRGEEWLTSTPKHVLLYEFLGWEPPRFAHLPLLLNPDRSKLSKRQGDVAVEDYRRKGYEPQALVNFVALLGWNPGDERDVFALEELVEEFSLLRVGKAGAVFDVSKLNWINGMHLRRLGDDQLLARLMTYLEERGETLPPADYLLKVVRMMKERVTFVHEMRTVSSYFFEEPREFEAEGVKKHWKGDAPALVAAFRDRLAALEELSIENIESTLRALAEEKGISAGKIIHPVRLSVSGKTTGPGLFELMEALGKDRCLERMDYALAHILPPAPAPR